MKYVQVNKLLICQLKINRFCSRHFQVLGFYNLFPWFFWSKIQFGIFVSWDFQNQPFIFTIKILNTSVLTLSTSVLSFFNGGIIRDLSRLTSYKPYTLVGPTVTRPVQDPLAVLSLDNWLLYDFCFIFSFSCWWQNLFWRQRFCKSFKIRDRWTSLWWWMESSQCECHTYSR